MSVPVILRVAAAITLISASAARAIANIRPLALIQAELATTTTGASVHIGKRNASASCSPIACHRGCYVDLWVWEDFLTGF